MPATGLAKEAKKGATKHVDWLVESGATRHMSWNRTLFVRFYPYSDELAVANGDKIAIRGVGDMEVKFKGVNGKQDCRNTIKDVLYVPDITINLLSLPVLDKTGIATTTKDGYMKFKMNGQYIATAKLQDRAYLLKTVSQDSVF